jgi:Methyltransferase domain
MVAIASSGTQPDIGQELPTFFRPEPPGIPEEPKRISDRIRFQLWRLRDSLRDRVRGKAYRQAIFQRIHDKNLWGGTESVSGTGSGSAATSVIRRELPSLFQRHGVRSVLDAPCGDFCWMKEIAKTLDRYVGVDIVPDLIERNAAGHGTNTVSFICANIAADRLPSADLVLCRDCFIHFPTRMIRGALRKFRASGARYLLLTSDRDAEPYHDIPVGSFRRVNFTRPPFSFPAPICILSEEENGSRQLCLWELHSLPVKWVGSGLLWGRPRGT